MGWGQPHQPAPPTRADLARELAEALGVTIDDTPGDAERAWPSLIATVRRLNTGAMWTTEWVPCDSCTDSAMCESSGVCGPAHEQLMEPDPELPGMWEHADFAGGWADMAEELEASVARANADRKRKAATA